MKTLLIIAAMLWLLPITSIGQDIDSLNTRVNILNFEVEEINNEIRALQQKRDSLNSKLTGLNRLIAQVRYEDEISEGIPTKIRLVRGRLMSEPSVASEELVRIDRGGEVLIFDFYVPPFFRAQYEDYVGYISVAALETNDFIERKLSELEEVKLEELEDSNPRKARLIRKYGQRNGERLYKKDLWLGMTDEMARDALGRPNDINRTTTSWGVREQWVYTNQYLYFDDGILSSWQD